MSELKLQRLGQIMELEQGNPMEVEGTLNPAAVRGQDGKLYLFPRLVAKGNYSRIGIARVLFNEAGDPCGVERLGIALEPEAEYELREDGGGCEDPRVTYIEPLKCYIMSYTANSQIGPRIAFALSKDLIHWKRLGLAKFESFLGIDFAHVANKDACLFPIAIPNHLGKMQMAIIHRPLFPNTCPEETDKKVNSRKMDINHESMWISYCPMPEGGKDLDALGLFNSHHRLAIPVFPWERLKIGGGTPPILTKHGWLIIYHGVSELSSTEDEIKHLCYSAGLMILSEKHPRIIHYRSMNPVLNPILPEERNGMVPNVVFPTGIDRRDDLGMPNRFDVYYGMADARIGVARLDLPDILPPEGVIDSLEKKRMLSPAKSSLE